MAHKLSGALQEASRIRQPCPLEEPDIDVRPEDIHVRKGHVPQTRDRTAIMEKLTDLVSASPHHLKPLPCDRAQLTGTPSHPGIDRGIPRNGPVESK